MSSSDVLGAYSDLECALVALREHLADSAWQLAEPEVVDLVRLHHRLSAQVASLGLSLVREVEGRGVPASVGATSTQAYLSGVLRMSPQLASEQARVATALGSRYGETAARLADGDISYEQAKAITFTCDKLPAVATAEQKQLAEQFLLEQSSLLNSFELGKLRRKLDDVIDPDGTLTRELAAWERRALNLRHHGDGTQTITWRDTDERIAQVKAAMTVLAAPRPAADGEQDPRTAEQRRADALFEVCARVLRFGDLPAARGARPHLHVTVTAEAMRTGTGHGRTSTGEDLSASAIRRIACDADVVAIILDDHGVPLNVGRTHRTVTAGIWAALLARDVGCVFAGCTRPADYCQAHHIRHWSEGGETSLANTALLCDFHHDEVHHRGWDIELGPHGRPRMRPPPWVDPDQAWVLNPYWRDCVPELRLE